MHWLLSVTLDWLVAVRIDWLLSDSTTLLSRLPKGQRFFAESRLIEKLSKTFQASGVASLAVTVLSDSILLLRIDWYRSK